MEGRPLEAPSTDPVAIEARESSLAIVFPVFTCNTAWSLGLALRTRILSLPPDQRKPALISIALAGTGAEPRVFFQCATELGTVPDNEVWVRRKRNVVLRWGVSTWLMRNKMIASHGSADGVEGAFGRKFALASSNSGGVPDDYAIHGGGFPIRVCGVDGVVGAIVVSGLKQEHDHQVIVETVEEFIRKNSA